MDTRSRGVIHQNGKEQSRSVGATGKELYSWMEGGDGGRENTICGHKVVKKRPQTHLLSASLHLLQLLDPQLSLSTGRESDPVAPLSSSSSHSLHHVALLLFIYLLGSLSPLSQPIEAIAGVQPVVGVVVLTHSVPRTSTFHSCLLLCVLVSSLSARLLCFPLLSETKRDDLSPHWSSVSGCIELRARRVGGVVGVEKERSGVEGGRESNGVAMAAAATSVYLETSLAEAQ